MNAKVATALGVAAIDTLPELVGHITKKKEEKTFLEENKNVLFTIVLTIFVTNFGYISMFENVVLNSIINIIFGIMVLVLLCLFFNEVKNIFKSNSLFIKVLAVFLIILGLINSFYHICYAISNLF